jgi:hypothetical protein
MFTVSVSISAIGGSDVELEEELEELEPLEEDDKVPEEPGVEVGVEPSSLNSQGVCPYKSFPSRICCKIWDICNGVRPVLFKSNSLTIPWPRRGRMANRVSTVLLDNAIPSRDKHSTPPMKDSVFMKELIFVSQSTTDLGFQMRLIFFWPTR